MRSDPSRYMFMIVGFYQRSVLFFLDGLENEIYFKNHLI